MTNLIVSRNFSDFSISSKFLSFTFVLTFESNKRANGSLSIRMDSSKRSFTKKKNAISDVCSELNDMKGK